jgi:hypothetical protein
MDVYLVRWSGAFGDVADPKREPFLLLPAATYLIWLVESSSAETQDRVQA